VIRDAASANMNDVTSTKQSATAESGIVVLASNQATRRYWHADLSASAPPQVAPPAASFTASAATGTAPLPVQFTDTSTGSPTAWSWNFGDGGTATTQAPAHTYTAPGTYTVTMTATNGGGSTQATATVSVSSAPTTAEAIAVRASATAASTTAVTDVAIPRPEGVRVGDLLVAQVTSDGAPTMSTVPGDWTPVLSKPLTIAGNAKVFVYSHVVVDAAAEPATYTWQLSAAEKWGAGMTAFSGVDPTNPFDSPASTAVDTTYAAAKLVVPGVTTMSDGAAIIGGVGLDNMSVAVTQPSGWSEAWESSGAQVSELARCPGGIAGPSGDVTWTLSKVAASAGWIRALKPAPVSVPPAPTASFSASATTGQAPLPVQFTDTSTGSPTSWSWDFGDGSTAATQNPAHTFAAAGTYTVTMTATNAAGSSTWTTSIVVKAPAQGNGGGIAQLFQRLFDWMRTVINAGRWVR
jgi:PKD repeat protein